MVLHKDAVFRNFTSTTTHFSTTKLTQQNSLNNVYSVACNHAADKNVHGFPEPVFTTTGPWPNAGPWNVFLTVTWLYLKMCIQY